MKQQGVMLGLVGSGLLGDFTGEYKISMGLVNYKGETWGGQSLTENNIVNYIAEFRILTQSEDNHSQLSETITTTIYAGLGYRYLLDLSSSSTGGYNRASNYFYIPIGIKSGVFTLEYDYFIKGIQISYLSDADPGFNDITNEQDQGYGYRVSINLGEIKAFLKYWNIKKSDMSTITYYGSPFAQGYEPRNNSLEIGVAFRF